ncbi:MAG: hypothetical protein K8U03_15185 [Planctomycetia bacterium]|nr:hypothetical protein [Planctomycetia bacterium]
MRSTYFAAAFLCTAVAIAPRAASADDFGEALKNLVAVGPEAAGHRAAQAAWKVVASADAQRLPELLTSLDTASPLAANWIRAAIETIGERAETAGDKTSAPALEKFVLETKHVPQARRLAYDILSKLDKTAPDRLMPGFLDDPSTELRREAIDRVLTEATASKDPAVTKSLYEKAFSASRDVDQIKDLAAKVEKLGGAADLPKHFGFVVAWKLIGPFDNMKEKGYDAVYPPENEIKLDAKYKGKDEKEIAWIEHKTVDKHGIIDLNEVLGKNKGALAYAVAEFHASKAGPVDIRIGSGNAIKLWVNGKQVDARNVYHAGFEIDQYISHAELKPGANRILLKVCENEQKESWAQDWKFQLRVCDSVGTAVISAGKLAGNE